MKIGNKYKISKIAITTNNKREKQVKTGTLIYQNPYYYVFEIRGRGGSYNIAYNKAAIATGEVTIREVII